MAEISELLPCKRCETLDYMIMCPGGNWYVECQDCGYITSPTFRTQAEAIAAWNRRAEARQAPTDYSNLLSVITDIRERSGVGSKPMLSELADAIAERIAEPKVGDEIQFCPQCGWNSAMDATPASLPSGTVTEAWSYTINYGPDGEENYANVYTPDGEFVGNLKIHHARAIVAGMNEAAFAARPAAEPVAVKGLSGDEIMEAIRECFPWKTEAAILSLLTYEKSAPLFPQATYDVPSYRATAFVRAIEKRIHSLVSPAPGLVEAQTAMRRIVPYLDWTIGNESPGHHPTMPSAVAAFKAALASITETGGAK